MTPQTTRIAPSPTGYFHLGTARTAYFNWLTARHTGGKFILRIDDTDTKRNNPEFTKVIHDAMAYLKLDHDETFSQSDRFDRYRAAAEQLVAKGLARRDGAAFLFDLPIEKMAVVGTHYATDQTGVEFRITEIDREYISKMPLIKSDGTPTYHFASVVDDMDYGVTKIIRGVDHIPNTVRQIILFGALGAVVPTFCHVGLLHAMGGKKLSKSTGAASLLDYRDQGVDPDAMCNFLLRMGWGPREDNKANEIIKRDRAPSMFCEGGRPRGAQSKVDLAKLASLDKKYKAHAYA